MSTGANREAVRLGLLGLLPFATAVGALVSTVLLADYVTDRDLIELHRRTEAEAKHVAAQVRVGVLQAFDPLQRLAVWWLLEGRPAAPEDWETDARLFIKPRAGLRTVTWVDPGGRRAWVMRPAMAGPPVQGQPPDQELRYAMDMAARTSATAVSHVFRAGDDWSIYACAPVKRSGRPTAFIAGEYALAELTASVLETQIPEDYSAVVLVDGHTVQGSPAPHKPSSRDEESEARVPIANAFWTVRLPQSAHRVDTQHRLVVCFGVLASALIYACAAMGLRTRRRAHELLILNDRLVTENRDRLRAEQRIQELNRDLECRLREFQVLLEVLPVGITVADDPECRKIWMNRSMSEMLRIPMDQNISKSAVGAERLPYRIERNGAEVPPDELPMQVSARTGRTASNHEYDIVRTDGSIINTLSYAAPVFDAQGKVRAVINACVDITERKRAEEERKELLARERDLELRVERAEKYRSLALMAGGVAHDFNNLLTIIVGQSNVLAGELSRDPELSRKLLDVILAANRAAELTARLVAFTGKVWCNAGAVDLAAVVESSRGILGAMAPPGIEIVFDLAPEMPPIHAGIAEVQQILRHLVENAVEATGPAGGVIEIRTAECDLSAGDLEVLYPDQGLSAGHYVQLEVTDNGCGIPAEIVSRIFDPFFSTKFVGRGLGLSAVQGLVRAHGAGIRLESTPNRGTRVEIAFPTDGVKPEDEPARITPAVTP